MTPIRTAVILAAGMGTRLREQGRERPKGFLRLGERPIVEESIARLRRAGIARIVIATGHQARLYDQLATRMNGLVETVHNPRYADSGSMYSLYLLRERLEGPFLLLESDLVYEQRALTGILAFPHENAILLSGPTRSGDEVYVEAAGERVVAMSKNRQRLGENIVGELVGISKISPRLFSVMCARAEETFGTTLHMDYETDALVLAAQTTPVHYHLVPDLLWAEIDDHTHLTRARERIYPAIAAQERQATDQRA